MSDERARQRQRRRAAELTKEDFQSDQETRWCPGCGDYAILARVQALDAGARHPARADRLRLRDRLRRALRLLHGHLRDARHPRPRAGAGDRHRDLAPRPLRLGRHRRRRRALDRRQPPDPRAAPQRADQDPALQQPDLRPDQGPVLADQRERQGHQVDPVRLRGPSLQPGGAGARRRGDASSPARSTSRRSTSPTILRAAAEHEGTAFVEIYQNCNVFNDGAFDAVRGKGRGARTRSGSSTASRSASAPRASAAWSAAPTAASRSSTWPRSARTRCVVHDAHRDDPSHAFALAQLAEQPDRPDADRRLPRRSSARSTAPSRRSAAREARAQARRSPTSTSCCARATPGPSPSGGSARPERLP